MTIFGIYIDPQAFWLYVITGALWFFALDIKRVDAFERAIYRMLIVPFWPIFLVVCIARKL